MNVNEFINRVVDDAIEVVKAKELGDLELDGCIKGLEACRSLPSFPLDQVGDLLKAARTATEDARRNKLPNYQWFRNYEVCVSWVCNCLSVVLFNEHLPIIMVPTRMALEKAVEILGERTR
jgi:hypothetical protein